MSRTGDHPPVDLDSNFEPQLDTAHELNLTSAIAITNVTQQREAGEDLSPTAHLNSSDSEPVCTSSKPDSTHKPDSIPNTCDQVAASTEIKETKTPHAEDPTQKAAGEPEARPEKIQMPLDNKEANANEQLDELPERAPRSRKLQRRMVKEQLALMGLGPRIRKRREREELSRTLQQEDRNKRPVTRSDLHYALQVADGLGLRETAMSQHCQRPPRVNRQWTSYSVEQSGNEEWHNGVTNWALDVANHSQDVEFKSFDDKQPDVVHYKQPDGVHYKQPDVLPLQAESSTASSYPEETVKATRECNNHEQTALDALLDLRSSPPHVGNETLPPCAALTGLASPPPTPRLCPDPLSDQVSALPAAAHTDGAPDDSDAKTFTSD